jgi:SAM-dependent methyltransferase
MKNTNAENILYESDETFGGFFNEWRVKRVKKIEQVLGVDWFKGKKILELGCAYGNVGLYFKSLGADVTFSDGRQEVLNVVLKKDPSAKVILINEDTNWNLKDKFDLIIHFGISYNINHWQQDLINTIRHATYVAYETAINKFNNEIEFKIKDYFYSHEYHGPLNKIGSLMSISMIEKIFKDEGVEYTRYDDTDLNLEGMIYTLDHNISFTNTLSETIYINSWHNPYVCGGRKYWIIYNAKNAK